MVITTRIVVGAISVVCLMHSLATADMNTPPPPGDVSVDFQDHISTAVDKLQSHVTNTIDQLRKKLLSGDITNNGVPIKDACLELQTEKENFYKTISEIDPKYGNCSRDKIEAVKLAFSDAEERLSSDCGSKQYTPLLTEIQDLMSFSNDKLHIFDPCLPTSATDEQLSLAKECVDAALAKAIEDLDASEIFDRANAKGKEDATSCVETFRSAVNTAGRELSEDMTRCIAETDGNSSGVMTRRRVCRVICRYIGGRFRCYYACSNFG